MQFADDADTISLASSWSTQVMAASAISSSTTSSPTREHKIISSTVSLASQLTQPPVQPLDTVSQQSLSADRIFLPVQVFEAINFHAYDPDFIRLYANISIQLDIESNASMQFSREAITKEEINR